MLEKVGLLSGILIVIADMPYIWNALKRRTHPHRVTWFIIFVVNAIGLANQHASGAKSSLFFFIGATLITFLVFVASLYNGVGGFTKLDAVTLLGAIIGLVIWQLLKSPLFSVVANTVVAMMAIVPTFVKAYHQPKSETKITWLIGSISSLLAVIAVGKLDLALLLLPIYGTLQQASLFALIEIRERQLG